MSDRLGGFEQGAQGLPEPQHHTSSVIEEFPIGSIVRVPRSSGDIDSGWLVIGSSTQKDDEGHEAQLYNVKKYTDNDRYSQKQCPAEALRRVNPTIDNAQSLDDLREALTRIGHPIPGSRGQMYEPEAILRFAEQALDGDLLSLQKITRTLGIRNAVSRLLVNKNNT